MHEGRPDTMSSGLSSPGRLNLTATRHLFAGIHIGTEHAVRTPRTCACTLTVMMANNNELLLNARTTRASAIHGFS